MTAITDLLRASFAAPDAPSQRAAAEALGVSTTFLEAILVGRSVPPIARWTALAAALPGLTVLELAAAAVADGRGVEARRLSPSAQREAAEELAREAAATPAPPPPRESAEKIESREKDMEAARAVLREYPGLRGIAAWTAEMGGSRKRARDACQRLLTIGEVEDRPERGRPRLYLRTT